MLSGTVYQTGFMMYILHNPVNVLILAPFSLRFLFWNCNDYDKANSSPLLGRILKH